MKNKKMISDDEEIIMNEYLGGKINIGNVPVEALPANYYMIYDIIETNIGEINPYGSADNKIIKYPGDIDLREDMDLDFLKDFQNVKINDKEEVIKYFINNFLNMLKKIRNTPNSYLGDVKIGLNHIFDINIGQLQNGKIIGFDIDKIKNKMDSLYKKKYVNKEEYIKIKNLLKDDMSLADYEELQEELRNLKIIRWKEDELIRQYKILPPNKKYTLEEALNDKTMVKIDIWVEYLNKFIEVSNFYILKYKKKSGKIELINLPQRYAELIIPSLQEEVEKFMFSSNFFKPFKAIKRIFSLAKLYEDDETLEKIIPLLNSDTGYLNQINSDLDVLIMLLENVDIPPYEKILKELDDIKYRLVRITEFDIKLNDQIKILNSILDPKNIINKFETGDYFVYEADPNYLIHANKKIHKSGEKEKTIEILKKMKKFFLEIINEETIKYLKKIKLYPPPNRYFPTYYERKYSNEKYN